jgi:hypothetical protein
VIEHLQGLPRDRSDQLPAGRGKSTLAMNLDCKSRRFLFAQIIVNLWLHRPQLFEHYTNGIMVLVSQHERSQAVLPSLDEQAPAAGDYCVLRKLSDDRHKRADGRAARNSWVSHCLAGIGELANGAYLSGEQEAV